jgi:hypothetical protein
MKKIKEVLNLATKYNNESLGSIKITKIESLFSEEEFAEFAEFADNNLSVYAKETIEEESNEPQNMN